MQHLARATISELTNGNMKKHSETIYAANIHTINNGTLCGSNVYNIRGRFNTNKSRNSNYNTNARQGQYYNNNHSENQTVRDKDKWEHKTNPLDNSRNISNCAI